MPGTERCSDRMHCHRNSTSGGLWISEDVGDSWVAPEARPLPTAAVRFAAA